MRPLLLEQSPSPSPQGEVIHQGVLFFFFRKVRCWGCLSLFFLPGPLRHMIWIYVFLYIHIQYSSEDGLRLPSRKGNQKRSHSQSSHPMDCTCTCTCKGAHSGWPSECSADELYNNNNSINNSNNKDNNTYTIFWEREIEEAIFNK